ncbi:MAG: Mut7-C RNAse domain-containing protein [Pseudomonadota bacterium]
MVTLHFHGNLVDLLPRQFTKGSIPHFDLRRQTSVKDLVESLGVPHPEIEKILIDGKEVGFGAAVPDNAEVKIFPITSLSVFSSASLLRPEPLIDFRFIVDVNVAKLGVKLRHLGFDTLVSHSLSDRRIAEIACSQRRILLTRDRNLLKRKIVDFGHLVREKMPGDQIVEVVKLYGLRDMIKPYSRCLLCNGKLVVVDKEDVVSDLEPLTKKYYTVFHRCSGCGKIYWAGSHRDKMDVELCDIMRRTLI